MKIMVPIKRAVDYNVKVRPQTDGSDVDIANAKMAINPFCEIALEEAIRLREQGLADEVVVVTVGEPKAQEQLRAAMALGADRGILVESNDKPEPLLIAKALKNMAEKEQPHIVLMGKQTIDGENNQTGQMLAALLDWPQGTFASHLGLQQGRVAVTREIDGGLETLSLQLPAVITADLRLNEPRYASLPNIMKAKKKPLETLTLSDLGLAPDKRVEQLEVASPPVRQGGIKVASVDELLDKLKNEAKVIQ